MSGIKCLGLVKSCPGDEFPVGAKFESAMAAATTGVKVYEWVSVIFGYYKEGGAK
ncbi:MAG TPA: hypothetical protein VH230_11975 [Stellaceae bacterium]|nr:hypothetical protein [Stellaceae bacterium]